MAHGRPRAGAASLNLRIVLLLTAGFLAVRWAGAQKPDAPPAVAQKAVEEKADPILVAGQNLAGRALFLRAFPASDTLTYDATGRLVEPARPGSVDWTLAGMNVQKAAHTSPDQLVLEGVRVAIRYNPDAHEFQRHPLNDRKLKVTLELPSDPSSHALEGLFHAVFSTGIDPAMERATPPFWVHYFLPGTAWPPLSGAEQTVYPIPPLPPLPGPAVAITPPKLAKQSASTFTDAAQHDHVTGTVQLHIVVDADGVPQRIAITRPLGYGLDRQAAEAVAKWRFTPAERDGKPVAAAIVVDMDFLPPPHP